MQPDQGGTAAVQPCLLEGLQPGDFPFLDLRSAATTRRIMQHRCARVLREREERSAPFRKLRPGRGERGFTNGAGRALRNFLTVGTKTRPAHANATRTGWRMPL